MGGGTSWFPIGVEIVPGICSYLRSFSYLPPVWVAVNILHQCFSPSVLGCCELCPPTPLSLGAPSDAFSTVSSNEGRALQSSATVSQALWSPPHPAVHRGAQKPSCRQFPCGWGGLPAGGEWGPRQLRPHEEGRKMPAELLLLLIVAFASPSCQVLSSLRMGEALKPPSDPPPHRPSHWALGLFSDHAGPSGTRDLGRSLVAPAQLLPPPEPRSWDPMSLQPQIQESGPLHPTCSPTSEPRSPGTQPLLPQDPGVQSPTPVFPQLPSWTTRPCVAAANVWPWPWPGSRSTGSSRSQPRPAWKWTSLSCSGTASTRPRTPVSRAKGGVGVRQAELLPPSLPQPALFSSGLLCPFLHGCTASSFPEMALLSVWGGRESSSLGAALEDRGPHLKDKLQD